MDKRGGMENILPIYMDIWGSPCDYNLQHWPNKCSGQESWIEVKGELKRENGKFFRVCQMYMLNYNYS